MKVDLGIWDKLTRLVIFLLFVAGVLGVAVWYLPLIRQNEPRKASTPSRDSDDGRGGGE